MLTLPRVMKALELRGDVGSPRLELVEKELPVPTRGEVLVRVAASPVNPNDLLFLRGRYEVKKALPVVPGFEASGTIVGAGAGFIPRAMLGRRVACAAGDGDGLWAEYACVPAMKCAPLRAHTDLEAGATMLTNPMTAWVLVSRARAEGHAAVVLSAAAGALGQMLNRLFRRQGVTVINLVRSAASAELLRRDGAEHVIDTTGADFEAELQALAQERKATLALDAVGGALTGQLLTALPRGSVVRVYGMLSDEPARFDPSELVFGGKRLEGFTMYEWLGTTSLLKQLWTLNKVQGLVQGELKTKVRAQFGLEAFADALRAGGASGDGKVLFKVDASA